MSPFIRVGSTSSSGSTFCFLSGPQIDIKIVHCAGTAQMSPHSSANMGLTLSALGICFPTLVAWRLRQVRKTTYLAKIPVMDLGKASKKKREKSGQADRLGRPPLPLPRSGQENVKNFQQVVIFGVILPFYKGQNGSKFSQNRSGQAGGG